MLGVGAGPETSRDAHSLCASKLSLKCRNNSLFKGFYWTDNMKAGHDNMSLGYLGNGALPWHCVAPWDRQACPRWLPL